MGLVRSPAVRYFRKCATVASNTSTIQITPSNFSTARCCVGTPPTTVTMKTLRPNKDLKAVQGSVKSRPLMNLTPHTQGNLQRGAEFITKAHEIFVYCVSMSFNDVLKNEFDAKACVEICDPRKFIQRWQKAL